MSTDTKRDIFDELVDGFSALEQERQGKLTLKRVKVTPLEKPEITPEAIIKLRESKQLSRSVFAHAIRTNPRTLESWEQGRSRPNPHAALLIKLVEKYPETLQHLREI